MDAFYLKKTDDTPNIAFVPQKNIFEISGRSLPEDTVSFYKPVLNWIKTYSKAPLKKTVFKFNLVYLNTASSKIIISIILLLKELHDTGNSVFIEWYYYDDDEEIFETGEEFQGIVNMPFKLIKVVSSGINN